MAHHSMRHFLLYRKFPVKQNAPQGCALARMEYVAYATALGASVLQAIRFFIA